MGKGNRGRGRRRRGSKGMQTGGDAPIDPRRCSLTTEEERGGGGGGVRCVVNTVQAVL